MGRSQRHRIEEQGFTARGEIYEQGAVNDQILKSIGGAITDARPVLTSISPTTAVKGSADLTLTVTGSGFTEGNTAILFNGGRENTVFVNATTLTTIVKPSLVTIAGSYPVQVVKGASLVSAAVKQFTFTEA